MSDDVN